MKKRCAWVPEGNTLYEKYHDEEWGVPVSDDRTLFEFLVLENAQAGLSFETILKKRTGYKKVCAQFSPMKVAVFGKRDVNRLMKDEGIERNRLKIEATINNAKRFLGVQREFGNFSNYIWQFVDGKPMANSWKTLKHIPSKTKESEAMAKDLKKR